jgi:hypothetical protein
MNDIGSCCAAAFAGIFMAAIGFAFAGPIGVAGIFIAGTVLYLLLKPRQPWEDDPWRRN